MEISIHNNLRTGTNTTHDMFDRLIAKNILTKESARILTCRIFDGFQINYRQLNLYNSFDYLNKHFTLRNQVLNELFVEKIIILNDYLFEVQALAVDTRNAFTILSKSLCEANIEKFWN